VAAQDRHTGSHPGTPRIVRRLVAHKRGRGQKSRGIRSKKNEVETPVRTAYSRDHGTPSRSYGVTCERVRARSISFSPVEPDTTAVIRVAVCVCVRARVHPQPREIRRRKRFTNACPSCTVVVVDDDASHCCLIRVFSDHTRRDGLITTRICRRRGAARRRFETIPPPPSRVFLLENPIRPPPFQKKNIYIICAPYATAFPLDGMTTHARTRRTNNVSTFLVEDSRAFGKEAFKTETDDTGREKTKLEV